MREVFAKLSDREVKINGWNPVISSSGYGAIYTADERGEVLGRFGMRWDGYVDTVRWQTYGAISTIQSRFRVRFLVGESKTEVPIPYDRDWIPVVSTEKTVATRANAGADYPIITSSYAGFDAFNIVVSTPQAGTLIQLFPVFIETSNNGLLPNTIPTTWPTKAQSIRASHPVLYPIWVETSAIRESGGLWFPLVHPCNALYGWTYPTASANLVQVKVTLWAG